MFHPVYKIMCYLFKSAFYELFDGSVYGLKNIPQSGPFLLACNHASYFDPPFLGAITDKREVYAFAKKSLFGSKFSKWLFTHLNSIPVDRGNADIGAIKIILKLLRQNMGIMVFPEGTRTSDGNLNKAHAGIGLFACKSSVPVIPCRIFGTYEIMNRFSHFPNWNKRATIVFEKPITQQQYNIKNSSERYVEAANIIMDAITNIKKPSTVIF